MLIDRYSPIELFGGEVARDFVLSTAQETLYIGIAPELLADVGMLILDTGARPGEACELEWQHVHLDPAQGARFGRIHIVDGKTKNAKRNLTSERSAGHGDADQAQEGCPRRALRVPW